MDTFRGDTASAAVAAVAALVNEVSTGGMCVRMCSTLVHSGALFVSMQMCGRLHEMIARVMYARGVVARRGAATGLRAHVDAVRARSMRRWHVLYDGGLGFDKHARHNWELLRDWASFARYAGACPSMLCLIRKRFLREHTRVGVDAPASERDWATGGALIAAMSTGAVDVARVHNERLAECARAADMLYAESRPRL